VLLYPSAWEDDSGRAADALTLLRALPRRGRRLIVLDRIDGVDARESPHLGLFRAAGFVPDYRGLIADPGAAPAGRTPSGAE
jgi:hypothetical protein